MKNAPENVVCLSLQLHVYALIIASLKANSLDPDKTV